MKKKLRFKLLVVSFTAAFLYACGGGGGGSPALSTVTDDLATSISGSAATASVLGAVKVL